jgi:CheY-like chemotaxis protein
MTIEPSLKINNKVGIPGLRSGTRHIPVILLDLAMPIMDGRAFLKFRAKDALIAAGP